MGLDDFERQLAESKSRASQDDESKSRDRRSHRHDHRHRSRRHMDDGDHNGEQLHRHKRHHEHHEHGEGRRQRRRHHSRSREGHSKEADDELRGQLTADGAAAINEEDEWVEKSTVVPHTEVSDRNQAQQQVQGSKIQRDAWMQEPSALDIDYKQRRRPITPPGQFVAAKDQEKLQVHDTNGNLQRDFESDGDGRKAYPARNGQPVHHEVLYRFGDSGSAWRMTKLKGVYRRAEELNKHVDEVAMEQYGDFQVFDDAREEERELDRRKMYGKEYVGPDKPSGELFKERIQKASAKQDVAPKESTGDSGVMRQGHIMPNVSPSLKTTPLDSSALNQLKAQMMRAKLQKAPNVAQLEAEYDAAATASLANQAQSDIVVLSNMENRMLAGGRSGEVTAVTGKRGRERGLVDEHNDMSIEDMLRQEKRTRGIHGGEGRAFAERIAKDTKFVDDLDYMDDNAANLSKKVVKSDVNLRNTAIGDFRKMQQILENCPLCFHEDSNRSPVAPVISLATRTYMTLPTEPELAKNSAIIVPIQHRLNLLECDDDEWEEMRNFMKSLVRLYDAQDKGVIFYENAAYMNSRKGHAALIAVPLPYHLADNAPAYFKEAVLVSDEQWSQHKPIIDTLALVQRPGYGKAAFRKAMVKEMPYFHVFFTLDGGLGHVIEDERRWPKGDLFAREVIGGMLDVDPESIKKQGRWERQDRRVDGFRRRWDKFDWTKALIDAQ